jgi:hypothetical protein
MENKDLSNEELVSYRDDALEFYRGKQTTTAGQVLQAASDELFSRLGRSESELEHALAESVKLQSHYAKLLNMYDGGKRICFKNSEEWLNRLKGGSK